MEVVHTVHHILGSLVLSHPRLAVATRCGRARKTSVEVIPANAPLSIKSMYGWVLGVVELGAVLKDQTGVLPVLVTAPDMPIALQETEAMVVSA